VKPGLFSHPGNETVHINIGEAVKLFPGTVKMIDETTLGEKRPVKLDAAGHARRKEKKIAGGDAPGK
jgi:hypothetical protein